MQKTGSNRKNIGERSKPRGAVREGERPFPLTRLPLRIGLRSLIVYFAHANFFSPFPPNAEPGSKLGLLVTTL